MRLTQDLVTATNLPGAKSISLTTPAVRPNATHVYHQYVVRHPDREGLRERLKAAGIVTRVFPVSGEPTTDLVLAGVEQARQSSSDLVIAVGGEYRIESLSGTADLVVAGNDYLAEEARRWMALVAHRRQ